MGSVAPREGSTGVNRRFTQTVTWDVPGPENWNVLGTIDYRLRADGRVVFWLRWDQATNLFQLLDANGNPAGPQFSGGTPFLLGNDLVRLDLEGTEGRGSGPTGLRATLTLPLLFADALNGKTLTVELSGTNDFGAVDQFRQVGSIAVGAGQGAGPVGANNDAHEDEGGRVRQDKDDHRPPSEQAQRERERTNRSGKSDVSIEGNVVAVEKAPELNSLLVTVALTRDEIQVVQVPCSGSAGAVECYDIRVGDYLEADGYQHGVGDRDDFFVASDGIEVTRDGRKVK